MSGYRDLVRGTVGYVIFGPDQTAAPTVPEASPIQTTLPTSAYGQTIPVVWGKCRLPAAYIWVPPILTVTSTHTEWWDQITTTTSNMSCRLRFARPLVPDSTWVLRKLYCNGTLIYDASQAYRKAGLKFRAYDGRSTQGRDPTMTKEEGTNNISAHRGYLDVVLTDFDIQSFGSPPVFEGEWIQDGATTHSYTTFTTYEGGVIFDAMIPVWDQSKLYGFNWVNIYLYSIPATRQYFTFNLPGDFFAYYGAFRYSRSLDRLIYLGSGTGVGGYKPVLIDGSTGSVIYTSSTNATTGTIGRAALSDVTGGALLVGFSGAQEIFSVFVDQARDVADVAYRSATSWQGYANIECVTPGEVRGSEADFYFCADAALVKVTLTSLGTIKTTSVLASFSDDLRYAVYDGGDIVVWTDAATVSRVDGTTGTIEYTKKVPYQIQTYSFRDLGDPDLQRLTEELYFTVGGNSYFTDLKTGLTRQISGAASSVNAFFYDGATDTVLTVNGASQPERLRFIQSNGDLRLLSDFLTDLMVYGGGYNASQIVTENIDDQIQGAVVDITAGARDIARATCEPYSIAIFERSGQVIFKRALTDGSFAVDQSISSTGDILDQ